MCLFRNTNSLGITNISPAKPWLCSPFTVIMLSPERHVNQLHVAVYARAAGGIIAVLPAERLGYGRTCVQKIAERVAPDLGAACLCIHIVRSQARRTRALQVRGVLAHGSLQGWCGDMRRKIESELAIRILYHEIQKSQHRTLKKCRLSCDKAGKCAGV